MSTLNIQNIKKYTYTSDALISKKFNNLNFADLFSVMHATFEDVYKLFDESGVGYKSFLIKNNHDQKTNDNYVIIEFTIPSNAEFPFARAIDKYLTINPEIDLISLDFYNKFRENAYRDDLPF